MAWQVAGYGVAAAALAVAAAIVFAMASLSRSVRRLERTADAVGKEAEASLRRCGSLAEEARETLAVTREGLEGFASLAEGARALGEAVHTAAKTTVRLTELYRDCLAAPFRQTAGEEQAGEAAEPVEWVRLLRSVWKSRRDRSRSSSAECRSPETGADQSEGE
ncbi:hypothetical protein [Cohnella cellulosilytica]|uniref:DUF948 domain-containing protein n=1 Tax=Cohnella cellulosilytica TaxID=986710 RepID=A0ABW2F838_9BACL